MHVCLPYSFSIRNPVVGLEPQSFQFLVDAEEYHITVMAHDDKDTFEGFLVIVNTYIKNNSDSEINIDDRAKKAILKSSERSVYTSLETVRA